jgi:hypothetical protein
MLILRNIGGGGTLSSKLSQLLVEDAIDDIYEILNISSSMEDAKGKKYRRDIKRIKKGRSIRIVGYKSNNNNIRTKKTKIMKKRRTKYKAKSPIVK